jgi:hypothetical protein
MRKALLDFLKLALSVVSIGGGLAGGFFGLRPVVTELMMRSAQEPSTNLELYNEFFNSPPVVLIAIFLGGLVGCAVAFAVEIGWNRLVAVGFIPSEPVDETVKKVKVRLWGGKLLDGNSEDGNNGQYIFEMSVRADQLSDFFHKRSAPALLCKKSDGTALKLLHERASVYNDEAPATGSGKIVMTFRREGKVIYAFETVDVGTYRRADTSSLAHCSYALTFPGVEEPVNALLMFSGPHREMAEIFLES